MGPVQTFRAPLHEQGSATAARSVVVGMGANLGSRMSTLRAALALLEGQHDIRARRLSRVYETAAVGLPGPAYLNAAALLETRLDLDGLMEVLLDVERTLGRTRRRRWAARTLDLDLLWADGEERRSEHLVVPHPRLRERPFALAPLLDVWRDAGLERALLALGGPPAPSAPFLRTPQFTHDGDGNGVSLGAQASDEAEVVAEALTGLAGLLCPQMEAAQGGATPPVCEVAPTSTRDLLGSATVALLDRVARGFAVSQVAVGVTRKDGTVDVRFVGVPGGCAPARIAPGPALLFAGPGARCTAVLAVRRQAPE